MKLKLAVFYAILFSSSVYAAEGQKCPDISGSYQFDPKMCEVSTVGRGHDFFSKALHPILNFTHAQKFKITQNGCESIEVESLDSNEGTKALPLTQNDLLKSRLFLDPFSSKKVKVRMENGAIKITTKENDDGRGIFGLDLFRLRTSTELVKTADGQLEFNFESSDWSLSTLLFVPYAMERNTTTENCLMMPD